MNKPTKTAITPTREDNYPEWYQQVVKAADMAETSAVRGCMVIKPWGFGVWENMQQVLDRRFKETGHVNAYFPLLIPMSYLEKEAEHVAGFAKEIAVVTHHRLEESPDGGLQPAGPLEEPYVIRPTSETIIGASFSKWVQSYRDLPLLINQWANVMRWEMRTRLFLRTSEFLWQEGHTAHATADEAKKETMQMLDIYEEFAENYMAMPVIKGEKTPDEKFPGADATYAIESMMQDRKALQAGTSHFLGQSFAKASEIKFLDQNGSEQFAWTTSWGVSTRLVGGMIMTHSDDNGLVLPPKLAPTQIIILPIYRKDEDRADVLEFCDRLKKDLGEQTLDGEKLRVAVDDRDMRGGEKAWSWIKKGVPIRLEVGPRDVAAGAVMCGRRDHDNRDKNSIPRDTFVASASEMLGSIQSGLLERARAYRDENTQEFDSLDAFIDFFTPANTKNPEIHGGFALCHWHEDAIGHEVLAKLKVTPRCIPLEQDETPGKCIFTGTPTNKRVIFAKSY